jgi:hypothetical protein
MSIVSPKAMMEPSSWELPHSVCASKHIPLNCGKEEDLNHGDVRLTVGERLKTTARHGAARRGTASDFWGTVAPFIHHMLSRSCICTGGRENKASSAWWAPNFDVLCRPREKITPRTPYLCKRGTSADILRNVGNSSKNTFPTYKLQLAVNNSSVM